MGSLASEVRPARDRDSDKKEINVLVTGFGPFLENKINPSHLIALALPPTLHLPTLAHTKINIHVHPTPIEVSYANILSTIPTLLKSRYDLTLNIGMAPSRAYYTLESRAHRDGYAKPDVRGEVPADGGDGGCWGGEDKGKGPEVLEPTYDCGDVWRRWKSGLLAGGKKEEEGGEEGEGEEEDVRVSDDAGRYLCDFIYYACLLEYWRRDPAGERPCAFLHVPAAAGEEDVRRGARVAVAAIGAVVGSMVAWRRGGKGFHVPVLSD